MAHWYQQLSLKVWRKPADDDIRCAGGGRCSDSAKGDNRQQDSEDVDDDSDSYPSLEEAVNALRGNSISASKRRLPQSSESQHTMPRFFTDYTDNGRLIGEGSSGSVIEVTANATRVKYACKLMKLDEYAGESAEVVKKELQMLSSMRAHPSYVRLHDYFLDDTHCVLVMELLTGGDLRQYLNRLGGPLSEDKSKQVLRCVLLGLAHLHATGVAHRDIKLENLMHAKKDDPSSVKIVDLGLSKKLSSSRHTVCGSPRYMAPETILQSVASEKGTLEANYDVAVDIWACGILLYILLSGKDSPYDEKHCEGVFPLLQEIARCSIRFDGPEWEAVSPEALALLKRMLDADPRTRITAQQALSHEWMQS